MSQNTNPTDRFNADPNATWDADRLAEQANIIATRQLEALEIIANRMPTAVTPSTPFDVMAPPFLLNDGAAGVTPLRYLHELVLVWEDNDGNYHDQPAEDLEEAGPMIDPNTEEEYSLVGYRLRVTPSQRRIHEATE